MPSSKRRKSISRPKRSHIGCLMAPIQHIFFDLWWQNQKWFWMSKSSQHQTWIWPWRAIWFVMLRQPNCPCIIARKFSGLTSLAKCSLATRCLRSLSAWQTFGQDTLRRTLFSQSSLSFLSALHRTLVELQQWQWNVHNDRNWIPWFSTGFLVFHSSPILSYWFFLNITISHLIVATSSPRRTF